MANLQEAALGQNAGYRLDLNELWTKLHTSAPQDVTAEVAIPLLKSALKWQRENGLTPTEVQLLRQLLVYFTDDQPGASAAGGGTGAAAHLVAGYNQLVNEVKAGFNRLAVLMKPVIKVHASDCKTTVVQQVMQMLDWAVDVKQTLTAPCCIRRLRPLKAGNIVRFEWLERIENHKNNVEAAVSYMNKYLLPEGMFAWPVQGISWLIGRLDCGDSGTIEIDNSQTDYILFMAGPNNEILNLVMALSQQLAQYLLPLVPFMVALVEAKLPARLAQKLPACRCQGLLEYVAVNQTLSDAAPMPVLVTDFNFYHTIHSAGTTTRAVDGKQVQCIHIAAPLNLVRVPEGMPASSTSAAAASQPAAPAAGPAPHTAAPLNRARLPAGMPASSTSAAAASQPAAPSGSVAGPAPVGHAATPAPVPASDSQVATMRFVQTLLAMGLETRISETAGRPFPTLDQTTGEPDDLDDNGGHGAGGMDEDDREDRMDQDEGDREAGGTSPHLGRMAEGDLAGGHALAWEQGTHYQEGCLQLDFQVSPLHISAETSGSDLPVVHNASQNADSDVSDSCDEGVLEAAVDNANAQQMMALLRHPVIYKGLGRRKALSSYTPRSREEFWRTGRLLPLDQDTMETFS